MVKVKSVFSVVLNLVLFIYPTVISCAENPRNFTANENVKESIPRNYMANRVGMYGSLQHRARAKMIKADILEHIRNLRRQKLTMRRPKPANKGKNDSIPRSESSAPVTLNEFGKPIRKAICNGYDDAVWGKCFNYQKGPFQDFQTKYLKCPGLNAKENDFEWMVSSVDIMDDIELRDEVPVTEVRIRNQSEAGNCSILIMYASWSSRSAKVARNFNAIPRAFENIRFSAIDTDPHSDIFSTFAIYALPTILLFHNGYLHARYTNESFNVASLIHFIEMYTDQKSKPLALQPFDYYGPIPTVVKPNKSIEGLVTLAWTFICISFVYGWFTETAFDLFLRLYLRVQSILEDVEFMDSKCKEN